MSGNGDGRPPIWQGHTVLVCCGSGGVGKTTVAAAIGLAAARAGLRAAVVTIDPARRLADALGLGGGLTGEPRPVALADVTPNGSDTDAAANAGADAGAGELWAMMLDAPAMFERVVRRHAGDAAQADRIVANRFYRNIATALSGTQEYMASESLYELHDDDRFDLVVVDTPPSRHALEFLAAPGVLARFLDHPVFKLLMLPTRAGFKVLSLATQPLLRAIGRVVGSDVLADTAAFFQAFAGMEAGFRERAAAVAALLHDPATGFVLVASPRADTVAEAVWFGDQLEREGFAVTAVIANRLHPRFGPGSADDAAGRAARASAAGRADEAAVWANLAELRRRADAERAALEPLIDRAAMPGALVEIPLLPEDVHDLAALQHIAAHTSGM